jgi:nephron
LSWNERGGNVVAVDYMTIRLCRAVAPKKVTIVGPDDAKFNDTISLECHTSNSNPEARISWILDGRHVKENGSRIATSPEGGWVSTSNLTTVVRSVQHNLSVSCYAVVQDLGQTIVSTKTISVICKWLSRRRK